MAKNKQKRYWIYKIINLINWKLYIGLSTSFDPNDRWKNHISTAYCKSDENYKRPICRALRKYKSENFKFEVIREYQSFDELKSAETKYIAFFGTKNPFFGYNLTDGGDGTVGYKHTAEAKKKMSKTRKERGIFAGEKNPFYGKTHSDENKKIISEVVKNAIKNGAHDERIKNLKVLNDEQEKEVRQQYATGKYSLADLAKEKGVSSTAIARAVKGVKKPKIKRKQSREHIEKRVKGRTIKIEEEQLKNIEHYYFIEKLPYAIITEKVNLSISRVKKIIYKIKIEKSNKT